MLALALCRARCLPSDPTGRYESIQSVFDFEIARTSVTTSRGLQLFIVQSALFAVTIVMLMQESTKVVLHSVSAYVKDVTNVRRVAACVLYIASGMLAFYRETGVERALASDSPIPMLVGISDSRIAGLYAEVLLNFLTVFIFLCCLRQHALKTSAAGCGRVVHVV
jgi:hypothetical protein